MDSDEQLRKDAVAYTRNIQKTTLEIVVQGNLFLQETLQSYKPNQRVSVKNIKKLCLYLSWAHIVTRLAEINKVFRTEKQKNIFQENYEAFRNGRSIFENESFCHSWPYDRKLKKIIGRYCRLLDKLAGDMDRLYILSGDLACRYTKLKDSLPELETKVYFLTMVEGTINFPELIFMHKDIKTFLSGRERKNVSERIRLFQEEIRNG